MRADATPGVAYRLVTAAPSARRLLEVQAERGGNIGSTVARLGELLDAFGADELEIAVVEAIAADAPHVGAVRQVLDRRRRETDRTPPVAVTLPDDPRLRAVVRPRPLGDSRRRRQATVDDLQKRLRALNRSASPHSTVPWLFAGRLRGWCTTRTAAPSTRAPSVSRPSSALSSSRA